MKNTKLLSLAGQNLLSLPEEPLDNAIEATVTTIDLSRNKLSELPDKMSAITTVTDLKLTLNRLTDLPEWIGEKYKYLQILDISKNCLQSLPTSFSSLKYLRDIDLSFNRYRYNTDLLYAKYDIIYEISCRFTELPEAIYDVVSLEGLIANDNRIAEINVSSLGKLRRLAVLNLANNNISQVPAELGNLKNIR